MGIIKDLSEQIKIKTGVLGDLDKNIGSILEAWLIRKNFGFCKFCNKKLDSTSNFSQFCSKECKESFDMVFEVRMRIGKRDLYQRGYD